ncbi:hypothetical protein CgunFtcFv8_001978 [Champsocephalus gunnari]|uniref:Uncharacterized protein n=1 Tax=Champsocephalus gunnari TaxID=52237 RepID=A0AAN8H876_CHAGU|nr:hypothetical protein CgunFtcFv8_001978 [Champsocephalus gunnari]
MYFGVCKKCRGVSQDFVVDRPWDRPYDRHKALHSSHRMICYQWTKTNGAVNVTPLAEEITKLVFAALHEGEGVTARASDGLCDWNHSGERGGRIAALARGGNVGGVPR